MSHWQQGLRFARWSLGFLFVDARNSIITYGLLLLMTAALIWVVATQRRTSISKLFLQGIPVGAPVAILALGVIYACEGCGPSALGQGVRHHWAEWGVVAILLTQLVGAAWLIYAGRGVRPLAIALQAFLLWWSLWAAFVAGMSLSGDWI